MAIYLDKFHNDNSTNKFIKYLKNRLYQISFFSLNKLF
jgi:hypothetical protein